MNLLKSFAATTGLTPSKSYIYQKLYPLDFDKYIVLDTQSTNPQFHYAFWFRVIELIEPFLSKEDIKIVHFIENKKYHYDHTYVDASASLSQRAYLLKKALYFCGSSKLYSLMSSEFGVNQCFLKSDYLMDDTLATESQIIHSNYERKAFVNPNKIKINNIRPEEIAKKIIKDVVGLEPEFDNTISIGKVFSSPMIELIPDCSFSVAKPKANEIVVRMDSFFDEQNLIQQLELEAGSIVTNKAISENTIRRLKPKIKKIFFKVEKGSDETFLSLLEEEGVPYEIITTLDKEDLDKEKIKYLDFKKVNKLNVLDLSFLNNLDSSKLYFRSNKIVVKSGKTFPSKWHSRVGLSSPDVRNNKFSLPAFLDDSFKEEADYFYFLTSEAL